MAMDNGVMKMRPLDKGLVIDPGKTVKLAPGGNHLMLQELKGPFKQGDKVPVTLQFEKAGKVAVSLDVQGVGAQAPGDGGAHDEENAGSFGNEDVMKQIKSPMTSRRSLTGLALGWLRCCRLPPHRLRRRRTTTAFSRTCTPRRPWPM